MFKSEFTSSQFGLVQHILWMETSINSSPSKRSMYSLNSLVAEDDRLGHAHAFRSSIVRCRESR